MIHPRAEIHSSVKIGHGVIIGPNVIIERDVVIGPYCVIGGPPEHRDFYDDKDGEKTKGVYIARSARLFEFVTVQAGTKNMTFVGEGAAVFNKSHIAHDCILGPDSQVGGQASLAGHTYLMEGAILSGKSATVQWCVIGAYGFVGGFTFLTKHLPPGAKCLGFPARFIGNNEVGLQRAGLTIEQCNQKFKRHWDEATIERNLK